MRFLAYVIFACYNVGVLTTLSKVLPMIWSDTKTTLKSGESQLILMFKFETPCHKFYDAKIVPDTKEYFTEWCEKEVVDNVIRPLELMCRPASIIDSGKTRKKRFIGALLGLIPTIVSGVSSVVGLFSKPKPPQQDPAIPQIISKVNELSQDVQNIKNRVAVNEREIQILDGKVSKNEEDIRILQERTKELEKGQAELQEKVKLLTESVVELDARLTAVEIDVDQIKEWKAELTETLGSTVTLVSKLSAYFAVARQNLHDVERDWRDKRLNLALFDVFMVGSNVSFVEVYRGATPIECHMDARGGLATFVFKKDNTDFGVHVLRANPFTLYEMRPESDLGFRLEYVGPKQVAYDSSIDCIVPYADGPADVLLFPGEKDCLVMNDKSVYKYWRKSCELMYYLDDNVIQVKALGDLYYIYCYGFDIRMYKTTHKCPNFVFSVNNQERVEILNGKQVAKILRPSTFERTHDFHSTKAVYHLMPKILDLHFDKFPLSNSCPLISTKTGEVVENIRDLGGEDTTEAGVGKTFVVCGFVILAIAIVATAVGLLYYVRRRTGTEETERATGPKATPLLPIQNVYEEPYHGSRA